MVAQPSVFQAWHSPSWHMACGRGAVLVPVDVSRRVLLLLSSLLSATVNGLRQTYGFAGLTTCALIAWRLPAVAVSSSQGCHRRSDREPGNAGRGRRLRAASAVCWWP